MAPAGLALASGERANDFSSRTGFRLSEPAVRKEMKTLRLQAMALICSALLGVAAAQDGQKKPAYLDTSLSPEQRAADLVQQMTLEEKAGQLVNQARAIPRLNVPAYDWWSESLHGVVNERNHGVPRARRPGRDLRYGRDSQNGRGHQHRRAHQAHAGCAANGGTARSSRASTSGRRTSTSSAIRAGAAARRPTAKIRS